MLLSAVSVLVVAQSSSEILEGLMNNPVYDSYLERVKMGVDNDISVVFVERRRTDNSMS